jgi:hypothetical protein
MINNASNDGLNITICWDIFTSVPADRTPAFGYPVIDFVAEASREEDEEPQLDEDESNGSNQSYVHPNWEKCQNSKFIVLTQHSK